MKQAWTFGVLIAFSAASAAAAQTLGQGQDVGISWWRVLAALLLCLALGVAGAYALRTRIRGQALPLPFHWNLRRSSGEIPERQLRLAESLRATHQLDVCLITCDGAAFLIASSPHGVAITPVQTEGGSS